jgi:hypothetical protein
MVLFDLLLPPWLRPSAFSGLLQRTTQETCTGYFVYPRSLDLKINRAWSQRPTQAMTRAARKVFVDQINCVLSGSTSVLHYS